MSNVSVSVQTTMTSLELVEFINSEREAGDAELRHDSFMAKVPKVLGGVQNLLDTYTHPQNGQTYPCYRFPKREACLMAMSYSYDLQAKVFDRMTALEIQSVKSTPMIESPPLVDTCNALVASVEAKVLSKKEGAELIRAITLASFHGASILMSASKPKAASKALSAPVQASLLPHGTVEWAQRSIDTQSPTYLLKEHGTGMIAKDFNDRLEHESMMVTRYYKQGGAPTSYRVLVDDGIQYGQNVLHEDGGYSQPRFYVGKFAALLERLGNLVAVETEAVPQPPKMTAQYKALHRHKTIMLDAWHISGREVGAETNCAYVSRTALIEHLVGNGRTRKTAENHLTPSGSMMSPLIKAGFCRPHAQGWLITGSLAA